MVLRHWAVRYAALLLTAAITLLVTGLPAAAEATGEFIHTTVDGATVKISEQPTSTSLLGLKLEDGTILDTYCVEIDVDGRSGAMLVESPWSEYPDAGEQFNAHPEKVLWILHHSYPGVGVEALNDRLGTSLDVPEAIGGTQAAIWHFSNGADLDEEGNPDDVLALYAYLTGPDNTGIGEQPPVSLSITPERGTEAKAGKPAGPFTVHTTGSVVDLSVEGPAGVAVVDAQGKPLAKVIDGSQFWLSAPFGNAAGTATVKASARAEVQRGRLFVGVDNEEHPTQTLIVAASKKTVAKAEASARWWALGPPLTTTSKPAITTTKVAPTSSTTPSNAFVVPSTTQPPAPQGGSLPNTGASVLRVLGAGLLMLGAGIGFLLLQRRHSTS